MKALQLKNTTKYSRQDRQFLKLLKDIGINGAMAVPSREERKKIDQLFPD